MDPNILFSSPLSIPLLLILAGTLLALVYRKPIGEFIMRLTSVIVHRETKNLGIELRAPQRSTPTTPPLTAPELPTHSTPPFQPPAPAPPDPNTTQTSPGPAPSTLVLPPKHYRRLIGRDDELEAIQIRLRSVSKECILICGLGGIGKTALAREAVDCCSQDNVFDDRLWMSAQTEYYDGTAVHTVESEDNGDSPLTFAGLIAEIGRRVRPNSKFREDPEQTLHAVREVLEQKRFLIAVDNLDTVPDKESVVRGLTSILGKSKAVFTSRDHIKDVPVHLVTLRGLGHTAAVEFLKEEARTRNVDAVASASESALRGICEMTGGAPLAMKLVVGQLARLPLEAVLDALQRPMETVQDRAFYDFLYGKSWNLLDQSAKTVLRAMLYFDLSSGASFENIKAASDGQQPSALGQALDQLVGLSLIDKIGAAGRERFRIHPLTHNFLRSVVTE